nr:MAG TPA: hypothetical protein [Caudoviricetes sp.]
MIIIWMICILIIIHIVNTTGYIWNIICSIKHISIINTLNI